MHLHSTTRWRRPRPLPVLFIALSAAVLGSCGYEPGHDDLTWRLSDDTLKRFEENDIGPEAAEHLSGALSMLFGSPQAPRFTLTKEEWIETFEDEEFDPKNESFWGELSEEEQDAIKAENRVRFEQQFQVMARGQFDRVPKPLFADDLWAAWQEEFAPLVRGVEVLDEDGEPTGEFEKVDPNSVHPYYEDAGEDEETFSWAEEADFLFEGHYPTLRESAEMYRQQCLHCHGAEGGGDGPTSPYLEPRPRDYRAGKFKRVAVNRNQRPRRADLFTIIQDGIYTTAMPSFKRFSSGELHGLVDYVRLLSIRGEVESLLASAIINSPNQDLPSMDNVVQIYERVWDSWDNASDNLVALEVAVPDPASMTQARIDHGRELFVGEVALCSTCHGEKGRGDGASSQEEHPDGLTEVDPHTGLEKPKMVPRKDEWGFDSAPRNFHQAVFRLGNRPIDMFRRVKYGISGTIMPAADTRLSDDDIWDLVFYVRSMAHEYDPARLTEKRIAKRQAAKSHESRGADSHGDDGHGTEDQGEEEHGSDAEHGPKEESRSGH